MEPAAGAWARLRGRVDGGGRAPRRAVVAVLAGAGAVAAAIALVVVLAGDRDGSDGGIEMIPATPPTSGVVVTDPTATTVTTAPAATTTTAPVPYGTDGVIAATADGRVVLLDVDGGEVRTLVDASEGEQVTQVALDPDRAHLWYLSKPAGTGGWGCGTLYEVATADGSTAVEHGTADHFALSPDGGTWLCPAVRWTLGATRRAPPDVVTRLPCRTARSPSVLPTSGERGRGRLGGAGGADTGPGRTRAGSRGRRMASR